MVQLSTDVPCTRTVAFGVHRTEGSTCWKEVLLAIEKKIEKAVLFGSNLCYLFYTAVFVDMSHPSPLLENLKERKNIRINFFKK